MVQCSGAPAGLLGSDSAGAVGGLETQTTVHTRPSVKPRSQREHRASANHRGFRGAETRRKDPKAGEEGPET